MPTEIEQVTQALREGAAADIWYDAKEHGDLGAAITIERTQAAMEKAADLLTERSNAAERWRLFLHINTQPDSPHTKRFAALSGASYDEDRSTEEEMAEFGRCLDQVISELGPINQEA